MKTIEILKNLLIESGIRIPKGTKAAKIIYHADLDGIFSAILTYRQLIKQGINSSNIVLSSIQYGVNNKKVEKMLASKKGQMIALVDFARIPEKLQGKISFWSDHHIQEATEEKGTTSGRIGKTEYGSEAKHLATVHAQGLADPTTIKAITNIDSAKYKNLEDTVDLPKDFKQKGRIDRLANIVNILISELIKTNPDAINQLIKQSQPSLVSVYNSTLKFIKLNNQQSEAIKEISKENPDWEKIGKARASMPSSKMAEKIKKDAKVQKISGIEAKREKSKADIEKHTGSATTKFKGRGSVIVQQAAGRGQPSRFLGSLLTKQDNTRYGAMIREWGTMIQIALNPDLPEEARKKINLVDITKKVLNDVRENLGVRREQWAWEIITKESGGHAAISTISALGTIGIMRKDSREELKEFQALEKRAKALKHSKKKFKEIMPKAYEKMIDLLKSKEKFAERRKHIKEAIKTRLIDEVNKQLKGVKVDKPIKDQDRFKGKKTVKEDILELV